MQGGKQSIEISVRMTNIVGPDLAQIRLLLDTHTVERNQIARRYRDQTSELLAPAQRVRSTQRTVGWKWLKREGAWVWRWVVYPYVLIEIIWPWIKNKVTSIGVSGNSKQLTVSLKSTGTYVFFVGLGTVCLSQPTETAIPPAWVSSDPAPQLSSNVPIPPPPSSNETINGLLNQRQVALSLAQNLSDLALDEMNGVKITREISGRTYVTTGVKGNCEKAIEFKSLANKAWQDVQIIDAKVRALNPKFEPPVDVEAARRRLQEASIVGRCK